MQRGNTGERVLNGQRDADLTAEKRSCRAAQRIPDAKCCTSSAVLSFSVPPMFDRQIDLLKIWWLIVKKNESASVPKQR